jgi:hypothetical protein
LLARSDAVGQNTIDRLGLRQEATAQNLYEGPTDDIRELARTTSDAIEAHPVPTDKPSQRSSHDHRVHKHPTADDPLPGIAMSRVPKLFQLHVGLVLHELREKLKKGKIQSNQYTLRNASGAFPWKDIEHH